MPFDTLLRLPPDFASIDMDHLAKGLDATLELASESAFNCTFALMVVIAVFVFIASQVTGNYSWMDRIWPCAPVMHAWVIVYYAVAGNPHGARYQYDNVVIMYASLITLWGLRLVYNFYRRGGYSYGGEDYRWAYVRTWPLLQYRIVRFLFNLSFISFFQSLLLWSITLPMLSFPGGGALSQRDYIFAALFLLLLFFESVCDQQQWNFHTAKPHRGGSRTNHRRSPLSCGFCVTGVFGYSRHLNLFCEMSIWVTLAAAAYCRREPTASWQWWQGAGCLTLILLIYVSAYSITERLSLKRHPLYALYQRTTPMFVPAIRSTTEQTLFYIRKAM